MRVAMFGYQTWGHRTLQALLDSDHEVVLVVTHPKSDHAYEKIWGDSVAELAEKHDVPVLLRNRPDDPELLAAVREARPDILVANNWRTWLPPEIFDLPRTARSTSTTHCCRPTPASPPSSGRSSTARSASASPRTA